MLIATVCGSGSGHELCTSCGAVYKLAAGVLYRLQNKKNKKSVGGNFCPKPEAVGEGESILEGGGGVLLHIPAEPLAGS